MLPQHNLHRLTLTVSLVVALAMTSFAGGVLAERYRFAPVAPTKAGSSVSAVARDAGTPSVSTERIDEVLNILNQEYLYGPVNDQQQLYAALSGLVNTLPDNYTRFEPPPEAQQTRQYLSGEYEGIGIWIEEQGGKLVVVAPMVGSPAERAGLKPGDVLVSVDGQSLAGVSQDDAIQRLRGPAGSYTHVEVDRPDVGRVPLDIERARITTPAVTYTLRDSGVAQLAVSVFGDHTTEQLDAALKRAQSDHATGIVLDLRNNGGGWVSAAQEMIGRFVPSDAGPSHYEDTKRDPNSAAPQPIIAGSVHEYKLPVVVLVNSGTASAAEIVTGALKDYGRATVVGEKTFGKGSEQHVHQFDDGSSLKVTFAEWLTPKKTRIQGQGITPDVEVKPDDSGGDVQLDRAVKVLQGGS